MINVSTITAAIVDRLANHPALSDVRDVVRGEYLNTDDGNTPWIGVYRSEVLHQPRTLGGSSDSWRAIVSVDLAIQVSNPKNGEATEDDLEDLVQRSLNVLMEDKTFGNTVAMLTEVHVKYDYQQNASETLDFQMATVSLTMEVRTG